MIQSASGVRLEEAAFVEPQNTDLVQSVYVAPSSYVMDDSPSRLKYSPKPQLCDPNILVQSTVCRCYRLTTFSLTRANGIIRK